MHPEGAGAQLLQLLTQTAAGSHVEGFEGTGTQILQLLAQSGAGLETIIGSGAQTLELLAQSGVGVMHPEGTAAQVLQLLTQAGAGDLTIPGSAAQTLQLLAQDGIGILEIPGQGNQSLLLLTQSGVGNATSTKIVSCILVTRAGAPRPNLTLLSWAWFDSADPVNFIAPTDQGQVESTDASGEIIAEIPNSTLTSGQTGTLVLRADDGSLMGAYNLQVA